MSNEEEFLEVLTNDMDLFHKVLVAILRIDSLHRERAEAIANEVASCLHDEPLQVGIILDEVGALIEDRTD